MKRFLFALLAGAMLPPVACAQQSNAGAVPALYPTKAEAEKAASRFNCTGAHPMGDQWMPCASHSETKTHAH
ncbi:MAG: DUF3721 domain-containing protein [Synechococcus sp. ELA057]|jgi:hypothetical protein